ncbi:MAG TPA: amidohydrolase family protein [Bryobacteraceae bacterium]|nr:amidohydrolase family protein [Bryobacteraceae bacterium]
MHTIALEEHYATQALLDAPTVSRQFDIGSFPQMKANLFDLDAGRIAAMDAAAIDLQVLSLSAPGVEQLDAADAIAITRDANDQLGAAVLRHPARFAGFAALPSPEPEAAADELERTVQVYGFKGGQVSGHIRGRYLDDHFFWPILERAEALQVPLYLHPSPPPRAVIESIYSGFTPQITALLASGAFGWHVDTALHVLRLIISGAFDRYPGLQVIVGHQGETLPFMLPRFDIALPPQVTRLAHPVSAYLRENVHYTFGGFNWTPAFLDLLLQVGADRIMFSTDYPFASMVAARGFLDQLPVSPVDRERIAHGNAERLLRL